MKATKVNAGLAESNGRLLLGIWRDLLHITCGLTACTPGSAQGPTLGNEYGKTLPFLPLVWVVVTPCLSVYGVDCDGLASGPAAAADANELVPRRVGEAIGSTVGTLATLVNVPIGNNSVSSSSSSSDLFTIAELNTKYRN